MEPQDPLFDGVARDQAVEYDWPVLAYPMCAVRCLLLHGRVPPRVEQEDVIRGGQVQASAARPEREEHHGRSVLGLKAVHDRPPIPRRAIETQPVDVALAEARLEQVEQARPLGEDERLVSIGDGLFEPGEQGLELRGRPALGLLSRDQAGVAGRLPQSKERFESGHDVAPRAEALDHVAHGRRPHRVVDRALLVAQVAVEDDLRKRRQLRSHVRLETTQQKGADALSQPLGDVLVAVCDRPGIAIPKIRPSPEQSRIQEVELTPELVEPVLDRRTREREARLRIEAMGRARDLALGVLDRLGLVEDHAVPRRPGEQLHVLSQEGIAGDRDLGLLVEPSTGTVIEADVERGPEALDLADPTMEHGGRSDDERASVDRAERLQRLAEAHVVREQRSESRAAQEDQPVHALALVVAQHVFEVRVDLRGRNSVEAGEQRSQAFEGGRRRFVEIVTEAREVG